MIKLYIVAVLIAVGLAASSCTNSAAEVDERGWPKRLVYAYTPDEEDPGRRSDRYRRLAVYLSEQLGLEVKLLQTSAYGPVIEAMRARKVDLSNLSQFTYLIAEKKVGVTPIVSRSFLDGSPRVTYSHFIVRADSSVRDVDDLIARSRSFTFAFVNPASTSGHLLPRAFFESQGIVPEEAFKEVVFPGKHNSAILAVLSGQVDVAAVTNTVVNKLVRYDKIKREDLRLIWKSAPMPTSCVAIRDDLPESLRLAIRDAYLNLPKLAPDLNADFKAMYNEYADEPVGDYISIDASHYDGLRQMALQMESVSMLN